MEGDESFILPYIYRNGYIKQEERILEVIAKECRALNTYLYLEVVEA